MLIEVDRRPAYAYTGGKAFDPALPVVVFVHGAQHDHSVWALQSRYLAHHGYAVLAVDLPGHSRSAGPALASVEAIAAWVLALLAAVGASHATVVGHSMGSLVALECAARSDGIDGIVLIASAYPMNVSDLLLDTTANDEERAIEMVGIWSSDATHGGYSHKPSAPGPGFGIVAGGRRLMERMAPGTMHTDFVACNAYRAGDAAIAAVRCPALFILGANDAMTPLRTGRSFAARLPRAEVVELPGVGHLPMGEAPDATLDALNRFLSTIRAGRKA